MYKRQLAILLLMYISYVVHSYVRELRKKVPAEVATASIDDVQMSGTEKAEATVPVAAPVA